MYTAGFYAKTCCRNVFSEIKNIAPGSFEEKCERALPI